MDGFAIILVFCWLLLLIQAAIEWKDSHMGYTFPRSSGLYYDDGSEADYYASFNFDDPDGDGPEPIPSRERCDCGSGLTAGLDGYCNQCRQTMLAAIYEDRFGPGSHCDDCGREASLHDRTSPMALRKYGDQYLCADCKRDALRGDFDLRDADCGR